MPHRRRLCRRARRRRAGERNRLGQEGHGPRRSDLRHEHDRRRQAPARGGRPGPVPRQRRGRRDRQPEGPSGDPRHRRHDRHDRDPAGSRGDGLEERAPGPGPLRRGDGDRRAGAGRVRRGARGDLAHGHGQRLRSRLSGRVRDRAGNRAHRRDGHRSRRRLRRTAGGVPRGRLVHLRRRHLRLRLHGVRVHLLGVHVLHRRPGPAGATRPDRPRVAAQHAREGAGGRARSPRDSERSRVPDPDGHPGRHVRGCSSRDRAVHLPLTV